MLYTCSCELIVEKILFRSDHSLLEFVAAWRAEAARSALPQIPVNFDRIMLSTYTVSFCVQRWYALFNATLYIMFFWHSVIFSKKFFHLKFYHTGARTFCSSSIFLFLLKIPFEILFQAVHMPSSALHWECTWSKHFGTLLWRTLRRSWESWPTNLYQHWLSSFVLNFSHTLPIC